jgi:hygromycin-B 7''-O-kinase
MGRSDVYLQPDAKDPVLSEVTVLDIARAHRGRATAVAAVDESGGEARAYLLDGDVVVKTQRPHRLRPRTSLVKEASILRELAGPLAGRVPQLYGHGHLEAAEGVVEYLVMSRMPGDAVVRRSISGAARSALVHDVGALLARLHRVPTAALLVGSAVPPQGRDGDALVRRLEAAFADVVEVTCSGRGAGRCGSRRGRSRRTRCRSCRQPSPRSCCTPTPARRTPTARRTGR